MADFVSLNEFVDRVGAAQPGQFVDAIRAALRAADLPPIVASKLSKVDRGITAIEEAVQGIKSGEFEPEFARMKAFILKRYEKARSRHTFLDAGGNFVDCIGYEEQQTAISARAAGHALLAGPPPAAGFVEPPPTSGRSSFLDVVPVEPPLSRGETDPFGNVVAAPGGTVPVRRVTLAQLARLGRFSRVFEKAAAPLVAAPEPALGPGVDGFVHRHAGAQAETVSGGYVGCTTYLNLWGRDPAPGTMNLSQCWIMGLSPAGGYPDTVESGWMVQPGMYGGMKLPVLFVYFNPDGYGTRSPRGASRSGYGVNQFGEGFITFPDPEYVVNAAAGGFDSLSTPGGPQKGFYTQWQRDDKGNWILYCGPAKTALKGVGYFPAHLYAPTFLANSAEVLQFGGEVAAQAPEPGTGPMGSGVAPSDPAADGFGTVAFQKEISVQTAIGKPMSYTTLIQFETNFSDRGIADPYRSLAGSSTNSAWGSYVFFGGPDGPL